MKYTQSSPREFEEIEAHQNESDPTFATVGQATRCQPVPTNVEMAEYIHEAEERRYREAAYQTFIDNFDDFITGLIRWEA